MSLDRRALGFATTAFEPVKKDGVTVAASAKGGATYTATRPATPSLLAGPALWIGGAALAGLVVRWWRLKR